MKFSNILESAAAPAALSFNWKTISIAGGLRLWTFYFQILQNPGQRGNDSLPRPSAPASAPTVAGGLESPACTSKQTDRRVPRFAAG